MGKTKPFQKLPEDVQDVIGDSTVSSGQHEAVSQGFTVVNPKQFLSVSDADEGITVESILPLLELAGLPSSVSSPDVVKTFFADLYEFAKAACAGQLDHGILT